MRVGGLEIRNSFAKKAPRSFIRPFSVFNCVRSRLPETLNERTEAASNSAVVRSRKNQLPACCLSSPSPPLYRFLPSPTYILSSELRVGYITFSLIRATGL